MTSFRTSLLGKPKTTRDAINRATATLSAIADALTAQEGYAARVSSGVSRDAQDVTPTRANVGQIEAALKAVHEREAALQTQMKGADRDARSWESRAVLAEKQDRPDLHHQASRNATELRVLCESLDIELTEWQRLASMYEQLLDRLRNARA